MGDLVIQAERQAQVIRHTADGLEISLPHGVPGREAAPVVLLLPVAMLVATALLLAPWLQGFFSTALTALAGAMVGLWWLALLTGEVFALGDRRAWGPIVAVDAAHGVAAVALWAAGLGGLAGAVVLGTMGHVVARRVGRIAGSALEPRMLRIEGNRVRVGDAGWVALDQVEPRLRARPGGTELRLTAEVALDLDGVHRDSAEAVVAALQVARERWEELAEPARVQDREAVQALAPATPGSLPASPGAIRARRELRALGIAGVLGALGGLLWGATAVQAAVGLGVMGVRWLVRALVALSAPRA